MNVLLELSQAEGMSSRPGDVCDKHLPTRQRSWYVISTAFGPGGHDLAVLCCRKEEARNLSGLTGITASLIAFLQLAGTLNSLKTGAGLDFSHHWIGHRAKMGR